MTEPVPLRRRFPVGWIAGLGAIATVCAGLVVALNWWAALLFHEADLFYRADNGAQTYPDRVYSYYTSLSVSSYALHDATAPLAAGAVFAVLGVLAVLAVRWDRRTGEDR